MSTFNPDYPTSQSAGFLQHTYQTPQQSDLYYYPGSMNSYNAYGMPQCDSRRNTPMNPVNPFAQFGQTQPASIPESAAQPFSSYPPATPMGQQPPMGLNSMIESRRNIPSTPNNSVNPWAPQNTFNANAMPMTQAPVAPFNTIPGCMPTNGWFDGGCTPGYKIDMNEMALYGNNPFGFDRHQSWENYYTQNRTIPMPAIDWRAISEANAPYNNRPAAPQYPVNQYPTPQTNWREMAERNWSSSNL